MKEKILSAALELAERDGFATVRRDTVAQHAGVATGLVNYYYDNMTALRNAIMRAAIDRSIIPIVAQGLAYQHPVAMSAPKKIKEKAAHLIMG